MVTYLTTSLLLLVAVAVILYFRWIFAKSRKYQKGISSGPAAPVSLFEPANLNFLKAAAIEEKESLQTELLRRARKGELAVLRESKEMGGEALYTEVLDALMSSCENDKALFSLVSYVARDENLKITVSLAARFIDNWKVSFERLTVAEMLHVSALSDDAQLYQFACETAFAYWTEGRLPKVKPADLLTLIEGEYWILSSDARASGAGFLLKRSIREFRKQLVSRNNK